MTENKMVRWYWSSLQKQYKYYSLKESELTESMVIALNVSFELGTDPHGEWCEDYEAINWWKHYETEMKEQGINELKEWRNIPSFEHDSNEEYVLTNWHDIKVINNTEKAEQLVKSYDAANETEKKSISTQLNALLK
tara:strand:- start:417 stop:827 length:411 start_codon:yes stop_codon:yes gene_type:complete